MTDENILIRSICILIVAANWKNSYSPPVWPHFKKIQTSDNWFDVYQILENLYVFCESRHFEASIASLIIGDEKAALIDTGCGIGNLRRAVRDVTHKAIIVINTHAHLDHIAGNYQFEKIAMFDHPISHEISKNGVNNDQLQIELLSENLVIGPWPADFDPYKITLPPFNVDHWLQDGDRIDLGGRVLEIIHTPGESPDHICLLDRAGRLLFSGDILLRGPVWTHLEGSNIQDLIESYQKLMKLRDHFDYLMPSHNEPYLSKRLLPATLKGAKKTLTGEAPYEMVTDPWQNQLRNHNFGEFSILTKHE